MGVLQWEFQIRSTDSGQKTVSQHHGFPMNQRNILWGLGRGITECNRLNLQIMDKFWWLDYAALFQKYKLHLHRLTLVKSQRVLLLIRPAIAGLGSKTIVLILHPFLKNTLSHPSNNIPDIFMAGCSQTKCSQLVLSSSSQIPRPSNGAKRANFSKWR